MTEPQLQDYIAPLQAQRDGALNEVVNLRAQIAVLQREIAALRAGSGDVDPVHHG